VQFFRSPILHISKNESQVLCPADGKVVVIEETDEPEFLKDRTHPVIGIYVAGKCARKP
jgi:phosphatidylserine decarboxylase